MTDPKHSGVTLEPSTSQITKIQIEEAAPAEAHNAIPGVAPKDCISWDTGGEAPRYGMEAGARRRSANRCSKGCHLGTVIGGVSHEGCDHLEAHDGCML